MTDRHDQTRQSGDRQADGAPEKKVSGPLVPPDDAVDRRPGAAANPGTANAGVGSPATDDHNELARLLEELESGFLPAAEAGNRTGRPAASPSAKGRDGEPVASISPEPTPPKPPPAPLAPPQMISRAAKDPVSETPVSADAPKAQAVERRAAPASTPSEAFTSPPNQPPPDAETRPADAQPTPIRSTEPHPAEIMVEQLEALLSRQTPAPAEVAIEPDHEMEPPVPADQQSEDALPAVEEIGRPPSGSAYAEQPILPPDHPPAESGADEDFRDRLKHAALAGEQQTAIRQPRAPAREPAPKRAAGPQRPPPPTRAPATKRAPAAKRVPVGPRRSRPSDIGPIWERPAFTYSLIALVIVAALTLLSGIALLLFRSGPGGASGQDMQAGTPLILPVISEPPTIGEEPQVARGPVAMDSDPSAPPPASVPPRENPSPAGSIDAGTLETAPEGLAEEQNLAVATETVPVPVVRPRIEAPATAGDQIDPVPLPPPTSVESTDLARMPDSGNARAEQPPAQDRRTTLANISNYFNSFRTMEGEFIQVGPRGEQSEGVFVISKPGKIRFRYQPPVQLDVIADGRSVAVLDRRAGTQDLYPLSKTPLRYLLSEDIDLSSSAVIDEVREEADLVSLIINEKSSAIKGKLTLIFDRKSHELRQWIITDAQGLDTSVAIFNTVTGITPDPKQFKIYVTPRSRARRRE